jgi:hypothetical protein
MKKKVTLNLDAVIALILLFVFAFGFIAYQRYQYVDLLTEHTALLFEASDLDYLRSQLTACKKEMLDNN